MKTMTLVIISLSMIIGFAYSAMAEEWYAAVERSSSDYRSSVGATIAEVNGAKYTPQYTPAELKNAVAADTRQMAQASVAAARSSAVSSGGSVITGSSLGGGLRGGTNFQEFKK